MSSHRGKSNPKQVFVEKVPFTSFCYKIYTPKGNNVLGKALTYKSGKKRIPFPHERQISKGTFFFQK